MTHELGELEKSKLLNELELMPPADKRRISLATQRGRLLDDPHERDIQRARVAQTPWLRGFVAVAWIGMAMMRLSDLLDDPSSAWRWAGVLLFIPGACWITYRWWLMRRLSRQLHASEA